MCRSTRQSEGPVGPTGPSDFRPRSSTHSPSHLRSFAMRSRSTCPRPTRRLSVELLEDRSVPSGVDVVSGDPKDWPMYNHDPAGTRNNTAETRLRPDNVGQLGIKWSYPTHGPIAGTPAVVNDRVYTADAAGYVYALDRN